MKDTKSENDVECSKVNFSERKTGFMFEEVLTENNHRGKPDRFLYNIKGSKKFNESDPTLKIQLTEQLHTTTPRN